MANTNRWWRKNALLVIFHMSQNRGHYVNLPKIIIYFPPSICIAFTFAFTDEKTISTQRSYGRLQMAWIFYLPMLSQSATWLLRMSASKHLMLVLSSDSHLCVYVGKLPWWQQSSLYLARFSWALIQNSVSLFFFMALACQMRIYMYWMHCLF